MLFRYICLALAIAGGLVAGASPACAQFRRPPCADLPGFRASAWKAIDAPAANAKIWFVGTADRDLAKKLATELDTVIVPRFAVLAPRVPLADMGAAACHGADDKLDIYLIPPDFDGRPRSARGLTEADGGSAKQSPAFITLNRLMPWDDLRGTLAHEWMHAVQWAYPMKANHASYGWFLEAMANWAVDLVYGKTMQLEHEWADCYTNSVELPLTDNSRGHCKSNAGVKNEKRGYGAYLFFQFLANTDARGIGVVKAILEATQSENSGVDAIDSVIDGGFINQWPKFAVSLWNLDPVPHFQTWDNFTNRTQFTPFDVVPGATGESLVDAFGNTSDGGMNPLSILYAHLTFTSNDARSIAFSNPHLDQDAFVRVQALVKINGAWEPQPRQWETTANRDRRLVTFCRDARAERIEELVIIVTNSSATNVSPASKRPKLLANNLGCWRWKGTTSASYSGSGSATSTKGNISTRDVIFQRKPPNPSAASPEVEYGVVGGTIDTAYHELKNLVDNCLMQEVTVSNYPLIAPTSGPPMFATLTVANYLVPGGIQGTLKARQHMGAAQSSVPVDVRDRCNGGSLATPWPFEWFNMIKGPRKAKANGQLSGSESQPSGPGAVGQNFTWSFSAERQP